MKDLTYEELENAPHIVAYIYMISLSGGMMGASTYAKALEDHPEYFPEEAEHKRKYDAIPQSVHDAYFDEFFKSRDEIHKDLPEAKGVLYWAKNSKEYNEFHKKLAEKRPLIDAKEKELHKKYYTKYGI